ncbi:hypothetical protein CBL_13905 [Carabus blaptoides fortunei]
MMVNVSVKCAEDWTLSKARGSGSNIAFGNRHFTDYLGCVALICGNEIVRAVDLEMLDNSIDVIKNRENQSPSSRWPSRVRAPPSCTSSIPPPPHRHATGDTAISAPRFQWSPSKQLPLPPLYKILMAPKILAKLII